MAEQGHTRSLSSKLNLMESRGEYNTKFPDNYRGKVPHFLRIYLVNEKGLAIFGHFLRVKVGPIYVNYSTLMMSIK